MPPSGSIFASGSRICLIDEFQDTDPIQAEVMLLLTADDPNETDWRRCRPVPGSLFVVGDPKQSIYRFRRAGHRHVQRGETDHRGHRRARRLADGQLPRDVAPLVEWINGSFTKRFPRRRRSSLRSIPRSRWAGVDERSRRSCRALPPQGPRRRTRRKSWPMKARSWRGRCATRSIPAARFPDPRASATSPKPRSRVIS